MTKETPGYANMVDITRYFNEDYVNMLCTGYEGPCSNAGMGQATQVLIDDDGEGYAFLCNACAKAVVIATLKAGRN